MTSNPGGAKRQQHSPCVPLFFDIITLWRFLKDGEDMSKVRWVAAMALCEDEIQTIEPNVITATLKNGKKVQVGVYMLDDERMKNFDHKQALEAYNKVNQINTEDNKNGHIGLSEGPVKANDSP